MGLLNEVNLAIETALNDGRAATRAAEKEAIAEQMAKLQASGVLEKSNYTGDVDTALVHFMGDWAFDEAEVAPYMDLAAQLETESARVTAEAAASGVETPRFPVVLVLRETDETGDLIGLRSALVSIKPGSVNFSSTRQREEGVLMHAFTNKTAGVTNSHLSLTGAVQVFSGDVYDREDGIVPSSRRGGIELLLAESQLADDGFGSGGSGRSSGYAFANSRVDLLQDSPRILVGWPAVETKFIDQFAKAAEGGSWYRTAETIRNFFESVYTPEALSEGSPRLAGIVDALNAFDTAIGAVVIPPVEA